MRDPLITLVLPLFVFFVGPIGLLITARFKQKPWVFIVWFPVAATSGLLSFVSIFMGLGGFLSIRGGGEAEGFAAIGAMSVFLIFAPAILVLIASIIFRPAIGAARSKLSIPTVIGYVLILSALHFMRQSKNGQEVVILVKDLAGKPVSNANVNYDCLSDREKIPIHDVEAHGVTDSDGRLVVTLYAISSLTMEITAGDQFVRVLSDGPDDKAKTPIHFGYFWRTPFGQNEVSDTVPYAKPLVMPVFLSPGISFETNPVLARLDKEFETDPLKAIRDSTHDGGSNSEALKHLATIERLFKEGKFEGRQIFFDVEGFVDGIIRGLNSLKQEAYFGSGQLNGDERKILSLGYYYLGEAEPKNLSDAQKLRRLFDLLEVKRRELDAFVRPAKAK